MTRHEEQAAHDVAQLKAHFDTPVQGFAKLCLKRPPPTWEDLAKTWLKTIEKEEAVR